MANSTQKCEVGICDSNATQTSTVTKGIQVGRKVHMCTRHDKWNNPLRLDDNTSYNPGTGELKQN